MNEVSYRQVIWSATSRGLLIIGLGVAFVTGIRLSTNAPKADAAMLTAGQKVFHKADLAPFDGSDTSKPIYIGMNGLVYDTSSGRDFYKIGGVYHFLAGRDSSVELNMFGGAIIKRKYPVVGVLVD